MLILLWRNHKLLSHTLYVTISGKLQQKFACLIMNRKTPLTVQRVVWMSETGLAFSCDVLPGVILSENGQYLLWCFFQSSILRYSICLYVEQLSKTNSLKPVLWIKIHVHFLKSNLPRVYREDSHLNVNQQHHFRSTQTHLSFHKLNLAIIYQKMTWLSIDPQYIYSTCLCLHKFM